MAEVLVNIVNMQTAWNLSPLILWSSAFEKWENPSTFSIKIFIHKFRLKGKRKNGKKGSPCRRLTEGRSFLSFLGRFSTLRQIQHFPLILCKSIFIQSRNYLNFPRGLVRSLSTFFQSSPLSTVIIIDNFPHYWPNFRLREIYEIFNSFVCFLHLFK